MYGSEQARNDQNSLQRRIASRLFGAPHMGSRLRFWCNLKASKRLLEMGELNILEAGSESGALVFWLARKYPRHHVTGLEIDADIVQQCNRIKDKTKLGNVEFVQGDLEEPISLLKRFDLVYSTHVLEHVNDDRKALQNIHDSIASGGTLVLQVPRRTSSETLSAEDIAMEHHRRYTEEDLLSIMEDAGFQGVEVRRCYGRLGSYAYNLDRTLAANRGPFKISGILFQFTLLLGYIDNLMTKEPQHGGLIAIGRRG